VAGLKTLAADVRAILGAAPALSYAADWSEYFGHQPADGSGDVHFHLDPLWADGNVDFIGIDVYHPLTDWRDEPAHLDALTGRSPTIRLICAAISAAARALTGTTPTAEARAAQIRTPISDGAAGKPWVFRYKDLEAWWSNLHYDRFGGVESAAPTAWQPRSKPIWFTELGCPAVDKGGNQPNVFFDPKSAQSALPFFSSGSRDDLAQRCYLEAFQRFFDPGHPGFDGSNPVSPVYGGRMVAPEHLHLWAWDARPYPYFPERADLWSDGANWERGHWLNGRLGALTLKALIEAVLADHDFGEHQVADVDGLLEGYLVDGVLSARGTLEPLLRAFRVDAADAGEHILFRGRNRPADVTLAPEQVVDAPGEPLVTRKRAQETELASELVLRTIDAGGEYRVSASSVRRLAGDSRRTTTIDLPAILDFADAERLCSAVLRDMWTGRESAALTLPPSSLGVEPGDILALSHAGRPEMLLAERIEDGRIHEGQGRTLHLRRVDNAMRLAPRRTLPRRPPRPAPSWGPPEVRVIDFAPPDGVEQHAPRLAVFADPWPGSVAVYRGAAGGGFRLVANVRSPAVMGALTAPLAAGPLGRFDRANSLEVTLFGGALASLPEIDVLAGGNAAAIRMQNGAWEVLQFAQAELTGAARYRLTKLLRGQCGTEDAMRSGAVAWNDFVLLDKAVTVLPVALDALGLSLRYRFGPAEDDHAAPSFAELPVTAEGAGLRPFAPVHLRARRVSGSQDVQLTWVRRTRWGGVGWAMADAPLNEASEAYRLDIMQGPVLRRRVTLASPSYNYHAGLQIADLGGLTPFTVRISQTERRSRAGRCTYGGRRCLKSPPI
jgi:hypothetical protein